MVEEIVKALQAAKRRVWDGRSSGMQFYICYALDTVEHLGEASKEGAKAAKELIASKLGSENETLRWWVGQNIELSLFKGRYEKSHQIPTEEMQAYRHAWIDAMIHELRTGEKTEGFP